MKKIISVFLVLTIMVLLTACGSSIQEDWSTIIIGENLPTPQEGKLRSGSNLDNGFYGGIENVDAHYYTEYKNACIEMGYTIDSEETGNRYEAFNAEGYDLSLSFYESSDEISITLQAPEKLNEFAWPTNGIAARLPAPVSKMAKVTSDTSNSFQVIVGNTTIEDYNNYINACEQKGFIVDFFKNEKSYEAKDVEGYRLNVSYAGCNRINIMIQTPKQETIEAPASSNNSTSASDEIDSDFKAAMDEYEEFMNDYVDFMKKYKANPSDLGLLSEYADFMSDYADYVESFDDWEDEDLNSAELAYYLDVQTRVNKKLLEVAQ